MKPECKGLALPARDRRKGPDWKPEQERRDWRPRLSIDVSQEQWDDLNRLVPWGLKAEIFRVLVDGLISLLKAKDGAVIAAIVTNQLSAKSVIDAGLRRDVT